MWAGGSHLGALRSTSGARPEHQSENLISVPSEYETRGEGRESFGNNFWRRRRNAAASRAASWLRRRSVVTARPMSVLAAIQLYVGAQIWGLACVLAP
eukprot:996916-Prymnesium_polylepis.1